jgi:ppGpp synthetase/RelA/SpoT-type nucleotidyltranferase
MTGAVDAVDQALRGAGVEVADICGRPKSLFSVFRKMSKKGAGLHEIHDVRALRVVVGSEAECYAALAAVHGRQGWAPVPGKTKDYVRSPKPNGYQSLHTVVRDATGRTFEVQIRTGAMHNAAEYGIAAHWRYKEVPGWTSPDAAGPAAGAGAGDAAEVAEVAAAEAAEAEASFDAAHRAVDDQVAWARYMLSWTGQIADNKCRPEGSGGGGRGRGRGRGEAVLCPCPFPTHHAECANHEDNLAWGCGGAGMMDGRFGSFDDSFTGSPLISADSAGMMGGLCSPCTPLDLDPTAAWVPAGAPAFSPAAAAAAAAAVAAAPVFVIAVVDKQMRVLEVPRGSRLSDVDYSSVAGTPRAAEWMRVASVAVNRESVPPGAEVAVTLRMGDLIEVTHERLGSPAGSGSGSAGRVAAFAGPGAAGGATPSGLEAARRRLSDRLAMDVVSLKGGGALGISSIAMARATAASGAFQP